jgi:hypothetical protein
MIHGTRPKPELHSHQPDRTRSLQPDDAGSDARFTRTTQPSPEQDTSGRKSSLTPHPLADRVSDLAICSHLPLLSSSTPPRFRLHTYASRRSRSAQLKIENRTEGRWEAAVAVAVSIARGHDACYPFTAVGAADGATVTDERRTDYYLSAAEQAGESAGSLGWRRRHRAWLPRQGHGAAPGLCRAVARLAALLAPRRGGNAARPRANRPARGSDTEARTGRAETHAQVSRGCQGGARRTANSRTRKKPPPWLRAGRMREGTFGVDLREAGARHC